MGLTEKYRPKKFSEVKGQSFVIQRLTVFLRSFNPDAKGDKLGMVLHGPPGVGKTTLAHVAALEFDAEILEINSSDLRNKDELERVLRPASEQKSLFNKTKILLIDEVDGISKFDRGGLGVLIEILKSSSFPVILTANDIWDRRFVELRKLVEVVPVKQLNYKDVFYILKGICVKEGALVDDESLLRVAIKSNGDVRAALNDLEVLKEESDIGVIAKNLLYRDEKKDIFTVLKEVLKNKFSNETLWVYDKTDTPLDEVFLWLEENIPNEYHGEELVKAYDALSLADVYRGRIIRRQHWRFLVYQNVFLSAGVSLAKIKPKFGFTSYKRPERILKTWIMNNKNAKKNSIITKYCEKGHLGKRKATKEFPYMVSFLKNNDAAAKELDLSPEEIKYLNTIKNVSHQEC